MVKLISKEDKKDIERFLKEKGIMPPVQGKIILNITPDQFISGVEVNLVMR